ncbi:ATPase, T2SS/T4P/T4SS family [Aliikangiella sp. IMCC44359]|uniref:ATPase, T2SS/T4P/T4SS family n=1 Tax=Aliikangiella sp. IMCC44359 TaxID=3459125 RepID=UPI00403A83B7
MQSYSELFTGEKSESVTSQGQGVSQYRILLVDDEPPVLRSLVRCFRKENYAILTSDNPLDALNLLKKEHVHLVISDFKMPKMNGADFLREVKKEHPEIIRIMLTGQADTNAVMTAINEGAVYKFILKPWDDNDIRVSVALALEQYELKQRNQVLTSENEQSRKDLSMLSKMASSNRSQLLMVLNKKGLLKDAQVQKVLNQQMKVKIPAIKVLLSQDWVTEKEIRKVIKKDFFIEEVILSEFNVDPAVSSLIPAKFCKQQLLLPIKQTGKRVTLVMADPLDEGLLENLKFTSGLDFNIVMADCKDIERKLEEVFGDSTDISDFESLAALNDPVDSIEIIIEDDEDIGLSELLEGTNEPPAIRLANAIIMEAIRLNASDIHIQPTAKCILIRYRIDGVLHDKIQAPLSLQMPLVSRIKIMAELDITERRRPQDGRITVKSPLKIVDLRLSTLPTINGEKIVMRLLDRNASTIELSELGFSQEQLQKLDYVSTQPQGIILATGPTGSGKTTTLYSMLRQNQSTEKNYITIEDPVEYYMDNAGQVMVKENIKLDFPTVLKAVLRQDPDTILVGEIRDFETANIAFQAALTGHVVYSTLHTNSALATLARLFDLGLRPYVVASALVAIVAQRLVRKLCQHCKKMVTPEPKKLKLLGIKVTSGDNSVYQAEGCEHCQGAGLKGRIGLYEVLIMDEQIQDAIANGGNFIEIAEIAKRNGLKTIVEDAIVKISQGLVSIDEVLRVLGAQDFNIND